MKISLSNFRCYNEKIIEIPNGGMTLISGKNGAGKTTLLDAIVWCFYGKSEIPPYPTGKKDKVRVVIEFDPRYFNSKTKDLTSLIRIERETNPNSLIVRFGDKDLRDERAQIFIEDVLSADYDQFVSSSFVSGSYQNSLLSMKPSERLEFIKSIVDISESQRIKEKIKNNIQKYSEIVSSLKGELKVSESTFDEISQGIKNISRPDDFDDFGDYKIEQKILKERIPGLRRNEDELRLSLAEALEEEKSRGDIEIEKKVIENELASLQQKKNGFEDLPTEDEINELQKQTEKISNNITDLENYMKFANASNKAKKSREEYLGRIVEQIEELERKIISPETLFQLENILDKGKNTPSPKNTLKYSDVISDFNKLFPSINLPSKEENIKFLERLLTRSLGVVECPECETDLIFSNGELDYLEFFEDEIENFLHIDKTKIYELISQLSNSVEESQEEEPVIDLFEVQRQLFDQENYRELLRKLQESKENLPREIQDLFDEAATCKNFLSKTFNPKKLLLKDEKLKECLSRLRDDFESINSEIEKGWNLRSEYSVIQREINLREKKLALINKRLGINLLQKGKPSEKRSEELRRKYTEASNELIEVSNRVIDLQQRIELCVKYNSYLSRKDDIEMAKKEVEKIRSKLEKSANLYNGFLEMRSAHKESEMIKINRTLEHINSNAQRHLESLFIDPITISLENDTDSKKIKCCVETENRGNSMKSLSGSEQQRAELAFLLSVNELLGSKILILDEVPRNLDRQVCVEVFSYLSKISELENKNIIIVSHELSSEDITNSDIECKIVNVN